MAPRTTLGVGGPARYLTTCRGDELPAALAWARERGLVVFVLGGGSNLLVSDEGFDGLVVEIADDEVALEYLGDRVRLIAGAGAVWDEVVARAVAEGLAGIECLSGIPGRVGAAPIQNIGAYGQELADTVAVVHGLDLRSGEKRSLRAEACAFGYRWSRFKDPGPDGLAGRFVVTRVELELRPGGAGALRYGELRRTFGERQGAPISEVREAVLEIRRSKAMVLDPAEPDSRSAGSFFVNPVVTREQAEEIRRLTGAGEAMPAFPVVGESVSGGPEKVKLSAAWLIEAAGFTKGYRRGPAALSRRHALALVNRGGATAADLLALAGEIRREVRRRLAIVLNPEPVFLGFEASVDELLG